MGSQGNIIQQLFGKSAPLPGAERSPVNKVNTQDALRQRDDGVRPKFSEHLREDKLARRDLRQKSDAQQQKEAFDRDGNIPKDNIPKDNVPKDKAEANVSKDVVEREKASQDKTVRDTVRDNDLPKQVDRPAMQKTTREPTETSKTSTALDGAPKGEVVAPAKPSTESRPEKSSSVDQGLIVAQVANEKALPAEGVENTQTIGAVVGSAESGGEAPPLLLNKTQVEKLANVLLQTGVANLDPAKASDQEFAFKMAIDLLSLANVIGEVGEKLQQFLSTNPKLAQQGLLQLPSSAKEGLSLLMSLQGMLDSDNFAQLLGDLPSLTLLGVAEAKNLSLEINQSVAQGQISPFGLKLGVEDEVLFVRLNFATPMGGALTEAKYVPTSVSGQPLQTKSVDDLLSQGTAVAPELHIPSSQNRPEGLPPKKDVSALNTQNVQGAPVIGQPAEEALPEWLQDVVPTTAAKGYAPVQPKSTIPADTPSNPVGNALRKTIDQQAAVYRAKQKSSLPKHLQPLADIPERGTSEYRDWLQKVASFVYDTSRSQLPSDGDRLTYVFDDPEVMKLLKMLPVNSLRDVVRTAGKLGRLEIDPQTLQHSRAETQKARKNSAEMNKRLDANVPRMQESTAPLSTYSNPEEGVTEGIIPSQSQATSLRAPATLTENKAPVLTMRPSDNADSAAQRDIRQIIQGQKGADAQANNQQGGQGERKQFFESQTEADSGSRQASRPSESETPRQPQFREVMNTQIEKPNLTQNTQQAERAKRAAQIAQLAKRMRGQITMQILKQVQQNTQKMELQLNPRRLGKIDIEVAIEGSKASIRFLVERSETLETLKGDIDQLIQALRESGVSADQGAMEFSLKEQNQQQADAKNKKQVVSGLEEDEEDVLALGEAAEADSEGHYDLRV